MCNYQLIQCGTLMIAWTFLMRIGVCTESTSGNKKNFKNKSQIFKKLFFLCSQPQIFPINLQIDFFKKLKFFSYLKNKFWITSKKF